MHTHTQILPSGARPGFPLGTLVVECKWGAHGGAEAAGVERTQLRLGLCRRRSARWPPRRWHSLRRSLQQLQILASDWQAGPMLHSASQATGARPPGPDGFARPLAKEPTPPPPRQTGFACVLSLRAPLLHAHGKGLSCARPGSSECSGGLPWAHRSGGRTSVARHVRRSVGYALCFLCCCSSPRCCCDDLMAQITLQMGQTISEALPIYSARITLHRDLFFTCSARLNPL